MELDWTSGMLIALCAQSLVVAASLSFTGSNLVANRCLALALVVLVGMAFVHVLGWTGRAEVPPWLAFTPMKIPLALGPALYGYVHRLVRGRLPDRFAIHLAPAALLFAYLVVVLLLPPHQRWLWKENVHDDFIKPAIEAATLVSLTAYSLTSRDLLARYRRWLEDARSDADRFGAKWISNVLAALLATAVSLAALRLYTWFVSELDTGFFQVWLAIVAAYLGVQGLRTAEREFPTMATEAPQAADVALDWRALGQDWRDQIQASGWWRERDLTLASVARRLGTNTAYLSRAINDGLGVNFNELINRMRADDVAERLDHGDPSSLISLAFDAGFSSKATFNRAFRAAYGVSPTERKRTAQNQSSSPA